MSDAHDPEYYLRPYLKYNSETGIFTWLDYCGLEGKEAGWISDVGYRKIKLKGKTFYASRLAYFIIAGIYPHSYEVDHINRNPLDNSFKNLRLVTPQQNKMNKGAYKNSISGIKGVRKKKNRWEARIRHKGELLSLGYFLTAEEASEVYQSKARELRGEYAAT